MSHVSVSSASASMEDVRSSVAPKRKTGVLLVNLGTPDGTEYARMRRYLNEFLSDRRVIEWPRVMWQPILQGTPLSRCPNKAAEASGSSWTRELNAAPLRSCTREETEKLAETLRERGQVVRGRVIRLGRPASEGVMKLRMARGWELM